MESREVRYVVGEDFHSVECFEKLWQDVKEDYLPQHRIAVMLPCSYGKPYGESYIIRTIIGHLILGFRQIINSLDDSDEYKMTFKNANVLDLVDFWHMSSAGFIPKTLQTLDDGEYAFYAYDWNSARATDDDKDAWFRTTFRRLQEWWYRFGKSYYGTTCYFRTGSKSASLWSDLQRLFKNQEERFRIRMVDTSCEFDKNSLTYNLYTFDKREVDADIDLLNPINLALLAANVLGQHYCWWQDEFKGNREHRTQYLKAAYNIQEG